jgi:phosphate-selective porin OprO/OprP
LGSAGVMCVTSRDYDRARLLRAARAPHERHAPPGEIAMKKSSVLPILAVLALAAPAARAGDGPPQSTEREKQLEQRVDELERKLSQVTQKLAESGANAAGDELEKRVSELEQVTRKGKDGLFAYWGNGIRMDSVDGRFKMKIGGRIQSDWSWFQHTSGAEEDFATQIEAGEEFRRARLHVGGTIYGNIDFMAEYDFANGNVTPRDVNISLKGTPVGTLTVGNFKEPTSTEQLTSDLFIPFMERSSADDAFSPSYRVGFMVSNAFLQDRATYQLAMTRNSNANGDSVGNETSGEYNFAGRLAGRPWVSSDPECPAYLATAVSGSFRRPRNDSVQYRARPELHLAPFFVDTGAFDADRANLLQGDVAFVHGPFWAYADYFSQFVDPDGMNDVRFDGWSVAAGWFITGESKPYRTSNSAFDRITPKTNYDGKGGCGAWEVAARYSHLDLDDGGIDGGRVDNFTVGVSWYLNPNTRVMLDWVHAMQKSLDTWINGIEMRFQVDF